MGAQIEERDRLVAALDGFPDDDGYSVACIAGIGADTVFRLLGVEPVEVTAEQAEDWWEDPFEGDLEGTIGVTTVPGGCVLVQPWGFDAANSAMLDRLSVGTVAYAMYANPKSGDQGQVHRDGEEVESDLFPGGGACDEEDDPLAELYEDEPVATAAPTSGCALSTTEPSRLLISGCACLAAERAGCLSQPPRRIMSECWKHCGDS